MKLLCFAGLFLLLGSALTMGQKSNSNHCKLSLYDLNIDDIVDIGEFDINAQDKITVKSYKFMDTNLFINVWYGINKAVPGDMANKDDELILMLMLGKKAYKSIEELDEIKAEDTITNAIARVPLKSFDKVELQTMYSGKPQAVFISLKCEKSSEQK